MTLSFAGLAGLALVASAYAQQPPNDMRPAHQPERRVPPLGHDDPHAHRPGDPAHPNEQRAGIGHQPGSADHEDAEQIRARLQARQDEELARRRAARKDPNAWAATRDQRAAESRAQLASTWGNVTDRPEARQELATHAERMAQLNRILDIAEEKGDAGLVTHTKQVIQREIARDARVLHGLRGAP